ncbi:MAG: hypothetical protein RIR62_2497 [Pseudomonadota bacterium]
MFRKAVAAVLAAGMGLAGQAGAESMTRKGYEMPPYTVEARDGAREIRAYGPRIVAEVTVRGERRAAVNTGFRLLAGYIFGANAGREKIAMTVPVDQADRGGGLWTLRFTMPSAFTAETLPAPDDDRIRLVPVPPARMVVEAFGGIPDSDDMAARAAALADWAAARDLRVDGGAVYSFYDAPWTPAGQRRNEVGFTLR